MSAALVVVAEEALRVEGVTKIYPKRPGQAALTAVQDVSFRLAKGEILGLLGPNGAGKTTTIKMIAGLVRPTSGHIHIGPYDVGESRSRAVYRLGAVLEGNRNLHWRLTVLENLSYFGTLKGIRGIKAKARAIALRLDLGDHLKKRVGQLSRGLQQRVAIAVALVGEPQALLLDEPTLGLDVVAASNFRDIVRTISEDGCGIVLTTHQMEVAQALSDRIAIISQGRLQALDSLDQLLSAHRTPGYEITLRGDLGDDTRKILIRAGGSGFQSGGGLSTFTLPEGSPDELYRIIGGPLRDAGLELVRVHQQDINLEAIYRRIVGDKS